MGDCLSKVASTFHSVIDNSEQQQQQQAEDQQATSTSTTADNKKSMAAAAGQTVTIAASVRQTATVIFMHGLGDTGHGWAPVFQQIKLPHVKYILPTAPTIPVTLNMGMQMPSWFDIRGLNVSAAEDVEGIKRASATIQKIIDDEIKNGIPSQRIVLGGFSQGGGLALYTALTCEKPLAGILAFSCWLPLRDTFAGSSHRANLDTPILQCHGDQDPLILYTIGKQTAEFVKTLGVKNHDFKTYRNMGHSSCDEEIKDAKKFLQERLP